MKTCIFLMNSIYPLSVRVVGALLMISQPVFSIFPVLHCTLGPAKLQACPFPDVVFPPLPLSALSSPFYCALQDGFGPTWWMGNMTIPLQFASLYDRQEIFVLSNCLLDLGTDFLVGNMVFDQTWWKGEEDKADKGRGRKTTSGTGQAWSSASPRGQWTTGKNGENWLVP